MAPPRLGARLTRTRVERTAPSGLIGVNVETGVVEFSGRSVSFAASVRIADLVFEGSSVIEAGASRG